MIAERRPFITDRRLLAALEGQRYVVLRPPAHIVSLFREVQSQFRAVLPAAVTYPAEPHVTLRGFPVGTDLTILRSVVATWADSVPPLDLTIEDLSAFPPPHKVPILKIRRTRELVRAFMSLAGLASAAKLPEFPNVPSPDDWVFHLSIAYCLAVDDATWSAVSSLVASRAGITASCIVDHAELVDYDGGVEQLGGAYELLGIGSEGNTVRRTTG
jgi:2'-5' RNA ligase